MSSYRPKREPRVETLSLHGVRHRLLRWGPPGPAPIVLLHGFQDCAATFQFLVDALPNDWSFAAPDLRGFGGSESQGRPYWFPEYLADLDGLLVHLGVTPATGRLIGHSMGGNIAMLFAGVRPKFWRWLVSLEGFGLPRTQASDAPDRYAQWLDQLIAGPAPRSRYPNSAVLAQKLLRRNPRLAPDIAEFVATAWSRPCADADAVELCTDPWHRLINPVLYRREEAEAAWARIAAPVLMLLGDRSEYLTRIVRDEDEQRMRRVVPRYTAQRLPQCGHMLHHEDPAAVARAIVTFVAAQDSV
jgi:pimeloyl-ACP methyl ester carboxylesterase